MGHGGPDWGTAGPTGTIFTIEDLGELAARLGSIVTFDRRGNLIWLDDFESGIEKWRQLGNGSLTWDATRQKGGSFSGKLTTKNVTNDYERMDHILPFPVVSVTGFEFSFSRGHYVRDIVYTCLLFDGDYAHKADIKWVAAENRFYYWSGDDEGEDYYPLSPTIEFFNDTRLFNTIKLVANFNTGYYTRLIVNDTIFTVDNLKYSKITYSPAIPRILISIMVYTNADEAASIHVDDVIITQNEP